jgi:predicted nucleic acid-binding protein
MYLLDTNNRNLILVTNNVSEFQRVEALRMENWICRGK